MYDNLKGMPDVKPMVIAIWSGVGKPNNLTEFLQPFVNDLNHIFQNGIIINDYRIDIIIRCFLCDSPARSFLKGLHFSIEILVQIVYLNVSSFPKVISHY